MIFSIRESLALQKRISLTLSIWHSGGAGAVKVNVCQTTNGIIWPVTTHRGINHQRLAPHGHAYSATVAADRFFVGMLDLGRSEDRWVKGRGRSSIVRVNRVSEQWGRKGPAHHPPKARRRAVLWPPERDESGGEGRSQTLGSQSF